VALVFGATGSIAGHAANEKGGVWSDWYRYPVALAVYKLSQIRKKLQNSNLFDTYEHFPTGGTCSNETRYVRTIDGTCNDQKLPLMGSKNMRLGRNVPVEHTYPDEEALLTPNPRELSLELLTRKEFVPATSLNLLAVFWVQFMTHDWFNHTENKVDEPFELPLGKNDPSGQSTMIVPRTAHDTTQSTNRPPAYPNENTHWWDGSQIYGSDLATSNSLRTFKDGLLTIDENGRLPVGSNGIEKTGFTRNWWMGLSILHHVFAMEHNAIARHLKAKYPTWNDQRLFDVARMINAAVMAKIHTVEWTPTILNNPRINMALRGNWYGIGNKGENIDPPLEFLKPKLLRGLAGEPTELHGVPFSMTEEFTSVYRMHSLLPETFTFFSRQTGKAVETLSLLETRNEKSHLITDRYALSDLIFSAARQNPGALVLNNFPHFLQDLSVPLVGKMDIGAVDILRDRERGVPRYNQFRRLVGLKPVQTFEQISSDRKVTDKLASLYHGDIEKLDLLVGSLAEDVRPDGFGFGETTFQLFILIASRRLEGDRFYTSDFTADIYTPEGMAWIENTTMKKVLLRHFPELATALSNTSRPFMPW